MTAPEHLRYTAEHEWVDLSELATVGITAHAVTELGDLVWLELPAVGDVLASGASCGEIESTKAVSEIYAPVAGEVVEVNDAVTDAPESVAADPYGDGWLFKLRPENAAEVDGLLTAAQYLELID